MYGPNGPPRIVALGGAQIDSYHLRFASRLAKLRRRDEEGADLLLPLTTEQFSNGDVRFEHDSVRGDTVVVLQRFPTGHQHVRICELVFAIESLARQRAAQFLLVLPSFPYDRADRAFDWKRVPVSARCVAHMIGSGFVGTAPAGALILDPHNDALSGHFPDRVIPDFLRSRMYWIDHVLCPLIRSLPDTEQLVLVGPDSGSMSRVEAFVRRLPYELQCRVVHINGDKYRPQPGQAEVHLPYDVRDAHCVIIDDAIDQGGTMFQTHRGLIQHGARRIDIVATHGHLSGPAAERIHQMGCTVHLMDTIPIPETTLERAGGYIQVHSSAEHMADGVHAMMTHDSLMRVNGKRVLPPHQQAD